MKQFQDDANTSRGVANPIWRDSGNPFTVRIDNYETEQVGRIVKSNQFLYNVTTNPGKTVKRKYDHFEWMLKRLQIKYPLCTQPHLPPKPSNGADDVTMNRFIKLTNLWLKQISANPVLQSSQIVEHFTKIED